MSAVVVEAGSGVIGAISSEIRGAPGIGAAVSAAAVVAIGDETSEFVSDSEVEVVIVDTSGDDGAGVASEPEPAGRFVVELDPLPLPIPAILPLLDASGAKVTLLALLPDRLRFPNLLSNFDDMALSLNEGWALDPSVPARRRKEDVGAVLLSPRLGVVEPDPAVLLASWPGGTTSLR